MPATKVLHLVSVLTFIMFIPVVVHCSVRQRDLYVNTKYLELITENENLRSFTIGLKDGSRGFSSNMNTFMEKVKRIRSLAGQIDAYGFPMDELGRSGSSETIIWYNSLRNKMPRSSRNELYSSAVLESLDDKRRRFLLQTSLESRLSNLNPERSCRDIRQYQDENLEDQNITISHVCTSLQSCAKVARPYAANSESDDEDLTRACTASKKCNMDKALPLMTGLFYTKVYELVSHCQCCLRTHSECASYFRSLKEVQHEADLLVIYADNHPEYFATQWRDFFRDAVSNNGHLEIDVILPMVREKRDEFEALHIACRDLQSADACAYEDVYKQYQIAEKSAQSRNNPTYIKDLRLHQQIDHAKLVELNNIKIRHIEILSSVTNLDQNLQATASGISSFVGGLARFDQGIADADAAFISAELQKYTTTMTEVQAKLQADLSEAMGYMVALLTARVADKAAVLVAKSLENSNPIKLIFSSPDLADVMSLANEVADAAADLTKGVALITSLTDLAEDTETFAEAFIGNSEQLSSVESLKDQILAGESNNLNEDADRFLQQYSAYTPQTDRSSLARNSALWSAYKDATCDLLTTDTGVISAIPKGIVGAKRLCEVLEGTLAQFFTLREDIFEFQFQMIDAMAGIVRGNLAQGLAGNIQGNRDIISGAQLLTTFFLVQSDLQTAASTYCDVIEYNQLGQPYRACATVRGWFRKANLDALVIYNPSTIVYHEVERFVTIPTQPSYPGDSAYVDLNDLAGGNEVVFQIPKNRTWLEDNRWTLPGQRDTEIPFVKEFEIYLPHKSYESGSIPTSSTMQITIKSIAGSYVSTLNPNTGIVYLLPRASGTYLTSYEENYSSCSEEINNPYSLCDNLPQLCVLSSRYPGNDALLPTILSTWSIRLRRTQGSRKLTWEAPHPSTNLSLSAKLVLRAPSLRKIKKSSLKLVARSNVVNSENGCCEDNRYRVNRMVNQECATCPDGSTAILRGLYCEIDQPSSNSSPGSGETDESPPGETDESPPGETDESPPESHAKRIHAPNRQSHYHHRGKSSPRHVG